MKKKRVKIYVLGTFHVGLDYEKKIKRLLKKEKINAFLSESVKSHGQWNRDNFIREVGLMCTLFMWFWFLRIFGKDFNKVRKIAKEKNVPLEYIDVTLTESINYFYRWYNWIIFLIILVVMAFMYIIVLWKSIILGSIVTVISTNLFYFGWYVGRTFSWRNHIWEKNIAHLIKQKKYNKVLIICGKLHIKFLKEKFIVEII